jgi:hypothetical protein
MKTLCPMLPPVHLLTFIPSRPRTTVEICTAIIAASFPSLKPLFKTLFDGTSARAHHYGSKYKGYIRDTTDTSRAQKSATVNRTTDFEMYDRNTDVKVGITCTTAVGSEESILPQKAPKVHGIMKTTCITNTTTAFVPSVRDGDSTE